MPAAAAHRFLFLQGPHGPFFGQLARRLRAAGASTWRVGFNRGDQAFWRGPGYLPFRDPAGDWPAACARILDDLAITDIVLYGDTRPVHARAVELARARGLRIHVFEEGYLRPFWLTYERDGSNGHSQLMDCSIARMRALLSRPGAEAPPAPARWGDMRQHVFYGALYHFFLLAMNRGYPSFRSHRAIGVAAEFRLHLRRLVMMPVRRIERRLATWRIRNGDFPWHLVLLQLEHDASFRAFSDFRTMGDFVDLCLDAFAAGAPGHHHLVFKAHPLEDGRVDLPALVREGARRRGLARRVHYVPGGKLAGLLRDARSVVTVNSTAAQQALWRGLPVRAFGRSVYGKPELVSSQPLPAFFAAPRRPDSRAYADYRQFLLETSQIPGGFYAARGRRQALRRLVDLMLAEADPYAQLAAASAAAAQHLRAIG